MGTERQYRSVDSLAELVRQAVTIGSPRAALTGVGSESWWADIWRELAAWGLPPDQKGQRSELSTASALLEFFLAPLATRDWGNEPEHFAEQLRDIETAVELTHTPKGQSTDAVGREELNRERKRLQNRARRLRQQRGQQIDGTAASYSAGCRVLLRESLGVEGLMAAALLRVSVGSPQIRQPIVDAVLDVGRPELATEVLHLAIIDGIGVVVEDLFRRAGNRAYLRSADQLVRTACVASAADAPMVVEDALARLAPRGETDHLATLALLQLESFLGRQTKLLALQDRRREGVAQIVTTYKGRGTAQEGATSPMGGLLLALSGAVWDDAQQEIEAGRRSYDHLKQKSDELARESAQAKRDLRSANEALASLQKQLSEARGVQGDQALRSMQQVLIDAVDDLDKLTPQTSLTPTQVGDRATRLVLRALEKMGVQSLAPPGTAPEGQALRSGYYETLAGSASGANLAVSRRAFVKSDPLGAPSLVRAGWVSDSAECQARS